MAPDVAERDQATINSFSKALELIDQARNARGAESNPRRELLLWKSAAEAEYLAFRIAIIHGLADYEPHTDDKAEPSVEAARELIANAQTSLESDPRWAYRNLRQAVNILRKTSMANEKGPRRQHISSPENG
jgi:hypothetical protein